MTYTSGTTGPPKGAMATTATGVQCPGLSGLDRPRPGRRRPGHRAAVPHHRPGSAHRNRRRGGSGHAPRAHVLADCGGHLHLTLERRTLTWTYAREGPCPCHCLKIVHVHCTAAVRPRT
ncbi:hypothetical protein [Microbispora sp. NPDC046933]|uniref:hypothetical protein n=1 Tax=Microbispora sp. NPDC046933 TaxID=3155618 RepID=UPI0033D52182